MKLLIFCNLAGVKLKVVDRKIQILQELEKLSYFTYKTT
jgi:hypothetical protein